VALWIDENGVCWFSTEVPQEQKDTVKAALQPERFLEYGCRVIKEPGACIICVANDDCARIPMHVHCRCKPEFYFMIGIDE
jgi:hypothetical protein